MAQLTLHWEGHRTHERGSHCVLSRGASSTYNSGSKAGTRQGFKKGSKRADPHRLYKHAPLLRGDGETVCHSQAGDSQLEPG